MIVQIEAYNYNCLKAVQVSLDAFHFLIGRNGAGKSVFMDVLGFLQDALIGTVETAVFGLNYKGAWLVEPRVQKDFRDLLHKRQGNAFTLAVAVRLPDELRNEHEPIAPYDRLRYQVQIGLDEDEELAVLNEELWLVQEGALATFEIPSLIDDPMHLQRWLWEESPPDGWKRILSNERGNAFFESEVTGWQSYLEPETIDRLALSLPLPQGPEKPQFPATAWFREFLKASILRLQLVPAEMRRPCPATASDELSLDGSNLPKVVQRLQKAAPDLFDHWFRQVCVELRALERVEVVQREEDNALYLALHFSDIGSVPQWAVSDGTLRFLALTLLGYLPDEDIQQSVWLIEEPENGVHPQGLELILQALQHIADFGGQVLIATHSTEILRLREIARPERLLCFRTENGATLIYRWNERFPDHDPSRVGVEVIFGGGVV